MLLHDCGGSLEIDQVVRAVESFQFHQVSDDFEWLELQEFGQFSDFNVFGYKNGFCWAIRLKEVHVGKRCSPWRGCVTNLKKAG